MSNHRPRCPKCGSDNIRGSKLDMSRELMGRDFTQYEFFCSDCRCFEERPSDAADFQEWHSRWYQPAQTEERSNG